MRCLRQLCRLTLTAIACVMAALPALHAGFAAAVIVTAPRDVWVSPVNGSDSNSGTSPSEAVSSLAKAQSLARQAGGSAQSPVTVHLQGGTYSLAAHGGTLTLSAADSHVHWAAVAGQQQAIVSGGVPVTGWTMVTPAVAERANGATVQLWQALAPATGSQSRHLFVDGVRATRGRTGANPGPFATKPVIDDNGYTLGSTEPLSWTHPDTVEFVYTQEGSPWTECRCTVLNVSAVGTTSSRVNMKQPCWINAHTRAYNQGVNVPAYIENPGLSYLTQAGEWYLDPAKNVVYYAAPQGHNMTQSSVIMPVLEKLVLASNVVDVSFSGIGFKFGTWLQPSGPDGYVEQQSGALLIGTGNHTDDGSWIATRGNLDFLRPTDVTFSGCEFAHLGHGGVYFGGGSHNSTVANCYFHDVSAAGVQLGDYDTHNITDPIMQERNNTVSDSVFDMVAAEFHGCVAVSIGYTTGTVVDHNTIGNLTYGGLSIGWGWARVPESDTYASNNALTNNRIDNYKTLLNDGGGLYALGPQFGSRMTGNFISGQHTTTGGGLYPDEGSAYWDISHNVVSQICGKCEWLHVWTGSIHNSESCPRRQRVHCSFAVYCTVLYCTRARACVSFRVACVRATTHSIGACTVQYAADTLSTLVERQSPSPTTLRTPL